MALDVAILSLVETQFLPNAVAVLYTVDTGTPNLVVRVVTVVLANQDTASHFVTLHKVPSGGAVAASNMISPAVLVPPKTMMVIGYPEGFVVMAAGQTLRGFADAASAVTITVSGEKYS